MAEPQSKQPETIDGKLRNQTVQNLPLLCVESICKFTPTFSLTRLHSNAVPLPGAFWNVCLEAALQKRLPLSLGDDLPLQQAAAPIAVFDAAGAKVASVKQPEAFRFSPLQNLIGRASLSFRAVPATKASEKMQLYVAHGEAILSHLDNVTELTLVAQSIPAAGREEKTSEKDILECNLKHLLPRLDSLTVRASDGNSLQEKDARRLGMALADYVCEVALPEMASLRRLGLPDGVFFGNVAQQVLSFSGSAGERILSQLSSLSFSQEWSWGIRNPATAGPVLMRLVASRCAQLSTLTVVIEGEFKTYLAAFRALASLSSLGLHLVDLPGLNGITFNELEAIESVSELHFLVYPTNGLRPCVFSIASLFPSTRALAFQYGEERRTTLELASEFCAKRLLPAVETLSCFYLGEFSRFTGERLIAFVANSSLPEAVDLSPMIFSALAQESRLLTDIYHAMQSNCTKSLLLRGPVPANALSNLQDFVDLNGENTKVIAWKDRDLGEQPGLLNHPNIWLQTDVKIVGVKNAGSLKGEPFSIRVVHQLTKRSGIFEFH